MGKDSVYIGYNRQHYRPRIIPRALYSPGSPVKSAPCIYSTGQTCLYCASASRRRAEWIDINTASGSYPRRIRLMLILTGRLPVRGLQWGCGAFGGYAAKLGWLHELCANRPIPQRAWLGGDADEIHRMGCVRLSGRNLHFISFHLVSSPLLSLFPCLSFMGSEVSYLCSQGSVGSRR